MVLRCPEKCVLMDSKLPFTDFVHASITKESKNGMGDLLHLHVSFCRPHHCYG